MYNIIDYFKYNFINLQTKDRAISDISSHYNIGNELYEKMIDKTLRAWYENCENAWEDLPDKYDDYFKRTWSYYLLGCSAAFTNCQLHLWHFVLTKSCMNPPRICI